ncbi:TIGR02436 family protein [Myroides odoratimimus CCUG 12901]|uniref:Four helix bundle protein n=2 Tax=Myroides odoratimimus TaxID=76832 RepID=A0A0S7EHJ1_9FLAO|nr:four helix bundle protein [Myroides odoratimimus]ALU25104.1 four helix bundle protein [Myroides odoratimimus]EHO05738.1 TIGR02436 family protein [Myroides odoratimimus CCUG 12901]EHO07291.1 TIGR02436 family protein [Myroides odoratimimus CCUG 10230]MDM1035610.1 four helix bundle protein [Myroides odoratimimus]MDM1066647.1 four helix bundle protein [Myroides odoratimimus]
MKEDNITQIKSFKFAVRIIKVYQHLTTEKKEYILSKQLLRSGTSIGANIEETIGAQSEKDFLSKLSIAYKEARETHYWIRLLAETDYFTPKEKNSLLKDIEELLKLIGSIQISLKAKLESAK